MKAKMNERLFRLVKLMLKDGETIAETARYFDLGATTVQRVRASETFEEYQHIIMAIYAKKKAHKQAPVTEVEIATVPAPEAPKKAPCGPETTALSRYYSDNRVWDALKTQNELLTLISNKLTALLECWKS